MGEPCPFCGKTHDPGPTGEPGTWLAGIEFKPCPNIPEDCFYEDREFMHGPRGALHKIRRGSDLSHTERD